MTTGQCGENILQINWKFFLKIWNQKTKEVYGKTPQEVAATQKQDMIIEMQYLQQKYEALPLATRELMNADLATLEAMSNNQLSSYLYGVRLLTKTAKPMAQFRTQTLLTSFFPPQQHQDPGDRSKLDPGGI
jgi:hypothetical protein